MTKITYIPGEIANAAIDEYGNRKPVTRTHHIFDDNLEKPQNEVNQDRIEDVATLDGKIALEKQRAEGVESGLNNRLGTVEQLAEISIGGGDAQIATGADFTNPDATKRAKVPTVGAIVDGLNDGVYDVSKRNPTAGPNSDGKFTLDYILSNADTLIPTGWRHGGMNISFVQSSDNKYVQYILTKNEWSASEADWEKMNLEEEVSQLGQEIFDTREYGTIVGKYITGSAWYSKTGSVSKYIKVIPGDEIHIVKNSAYSAYVAFISSPDTSVAPSFTNGTSDVLNTITDSTFQVITECYLWWLVDYNSSQHYEPSVLTLNGVDILTSTYSKSRIETLEGNVETLEGNIETLEGNIETLDGNVEDANNKFDKMVGQYQPELDIVVDWGEVVFKKYWNLVDGVAGMVTAIGYYARPNLYSVNPGQIIRVTVDNSIISDGEGTAAISCYDNDGYPVLAGGTVARLDWSGADSFVNNEDGTTTYTFTVPANCTQIGFYYKTSEISFHIKQNESIVYSETLDQHIEQVAGGGATTSGDSAKYFLKGESPKSFSKKVCILAAGQSNIDGRDDYADMPAEIKSAQPIANCLYVKNSESDAFAPINIEGQWAFDLVTYYNIALHQDLYVIKWSVGGTSIDPLGDSSYHWTADYEELESLSKSLLLKFETEIRNHIASDGSQFDVRAMLWHQGEGDRGSLGTGSAERYYDNLRNMVSYIRGVVGNERLPIITGTISENSAQYDATIHSAQVRLASEDPYFVLIDMSGAPLKDHYHFNAAASVYLGEMAYNALIDLGVISGTKLTPTRPW